MSKYKIVKKEIASDPLQGTLGILYGKPGSGKTYMGRTYPNNLVLALEGNALADGGEVIDGRDWSEKEILEFITELTNNHNLVGRKVDYLVVDSVSKLYEIIEKSVCQTLGISDLADIEEANEAGTAFGKPHVALYGRFSTYISAFEKLAASGMGVVLLVHTREYSKKIDKHREVNVIDINLKPKYADSMKKASQYGVLVVDDKYKNSKGELVKTGPLQHVVYKPQQVSKEGDPEVYNNIKILGNHIPTNNNNEPITNFKNSYESFVNYIKLGLKQMSENKKEGK